MLLETRGGIHMRETSSPSLLPFSDRLILE
jgi:hypothetical protein